ncbi:MAG: hypothetical protein MUE47_09910 [Acidobacteria bacterium]|nr:hypothetical protein [Acidobacteriota bacterium]
MRLPIAVAALLALSGPGAEAAGNGAWTSLPDGTATVFLGTGGDTGFIKPKGCQGRMGGALYRPAFTQWLRAAEPRAQPLWVSTGNLVDPTVEELVPLPEMVAFYGTVPYAAVAVGRFDLEAAGAEGIAALARIAPFPLLAANLRVLETGRPLVEEATVLDTPSGRIALIGVIEHDLTVAWGGPRTGTVVTVDPRQIVPALVARFRSEGARVVLVSNLGYADLADLLRAAPGVDAVVASNGSVISTAPVEGFDAPTLWVGMLGQQLARLAFDRTGRLLEASAQTVEGEFPIDPLTGSPVVASAAPGPSR